MKDFVWVVEVKFLSGWEAVAFFDTRKRARTAAKRHPIERRIRKYQRVGK